MLTVMSIFGTRPEAIKMAPVIKELERHPESFRSVVCVTAQHREMLDQEIMEMSDGNKVGRGILNMLGMNRAVIYGMLTRIWGVIAGPVTMLLIAARFTKEQQGFYYTFGSLLGLQVFFELGLLFVVAQFASHEFVYLKWGESGRIEGDTEPLKRFVELLYKTTKWFGVASLLMVVGLVPAGLYFFNYGNEGVVHDFSWRIPWILAVIGTASNLLITPFFAVIMGSGDVVSVNHREMLGGVVGSLVSWFVIGMYGGLYAVSAVSFGISLIGWSYLIRTKPELLKLAISGIFHPESLPKSSRGISWWGEIWPMQWRMAISSGAAYFIMQLFNPVLFHYHGAAVAGQMGMTLSAANALLGICMTLLLAKNPEFGKLVAVRDWVSLDKLFFRVLIQAASLAVTGAVIGTCIIWFLQSNFSIGQRFIPTPYAALLFASMCVLVVINGFAVYLRAHKQEPLMVAILISSIIQGLVTWLLGMQYGVLGVVIGFFSVMVLFILPAVYFVWRRSRKYWHTA
ncbi:membrane protein [Geobacter sp. AOG1]|nr:membrane protein [Geobacter sp. AOG1]